MFFPITCHMYNLWSEVVFYSLWPTKPFLGHDVHCTSFDAFQRFHLQLWFAQATSAFEETFYKQKQVFCGSNFAFEHCWTATRPLEPWLICGSGQPMFCNFRWTKLRALLLVLPRLHFSCCPVARPQRYEEFYSGTVRYGIFAKSRYTGIFRYGISLIFLYRDFGKLFGMFRY